MTMRERLENVVEGFHPKNYSGYYWDRSRVSELIDAILAEMETPSAEFAKAFGASLYIGPSDEETEGREAISAMIRAIREGK